MKPLAEEAVKQFIVCKTMLFRERADRQIRGDQVAVDAGKTVGIQVFQIRRFHVLAEEPAEIFRLQRDNIGSLLQRNRPLVIFLEKIAPVLIYPVVGILAMGLLMLFIVEPIMGTVNTVLNNGLASMGGSSKLILGMILGGMMAIDMGGPFNKAAYVFGTAAIAAGNYDIMASVMIGGMVPPCAIALATLLFKDKFTKEERESGPTNFIMGLAFITEGAIPFAAADPIHVLPACIIGSGLAGALSMAFGCTLMAPHGGIFVVPVMGNALLYLVAVVIGTVVSAVLLGVLKKKAA